MILRLQPKKRYFLAYILAIILLVVLPLNMNNAKEFNDITILRFRGDYFFHILLFLPWMFFHNAAFGNLRSGRSFWPLAFSFWSDGKTKGKRKKYLSQKPTANSQQLSWLLTGLFFAAGTEGLQYFLPWRAFNVNDLLANGLGVLLSLLSVKLMKISKHWGSKVKL